MLGLLLFCSLFLYLSGFVFYLLKAVDDVLNIGFVGIILDGDCLGLEICDDVFGRRGDFPWMVHTATPSPN